MAALSLVAAAPSASASTSSLSALIASLTAKTPVVVPVKAPVVKTTPAAVVKTTPVAVVKTTPATPVMNTTPSTVAKTTPAATTPAKSGVLATAGQALGSAAGGLATGVASTVTSAASTITSVATGAATTTAACPVQPVTKAFAKLGDTADYSLAPGGNFESGSAGWTLSGGATISSGNETTGVTTGSKSLQLPSGSIAISPQFCVDDTNPYFRFVSRNDGQLSGYEAIVLYRDSAGMLKQAQFTSSSDSSLLPGTWGASDISPLATKIPLLSSAPTASVQLMFVSTKISNLGTLLPMAFGTVSIDSVMVDPYRRG